jgi:hypothetical protein
MGRPGDLCCQPFGHLSCRKSGSTKMGDLGILQLRKIIPRTFHVRHTQGPAGMIFAVSHLATPREESRADKNGRLADYIAEKD